MGCREEQSEHAIIVGKILCGWDLLNNIPMLNDLAFLVVTHDLDNCIARKRPPDIICSDIAVIAAMAGLRAGICMIAVPTLILDVRARSHEALVTASVPQASDVQAESKPRSSASWTIATFSSQDPVMYPSITPSFIIHLLYSPLANGSCPFRPRTVAKIDQFQW